MADESILAACFIWFIFGLCSGREIYKSKAIERHEPDDTPPTERQKLRIVK